MKVVRCLKGHYYDSDKYDVCPYCGSASNDSAASNNGGNADGSGITNSIEKSKEISTADFIAPNMNVNAGSAFGAPSTVSYGTEYNYSTNSNSVFNSQTEYNNPQKNIPNETSQYNNASYVQGQPQQYNVLYAEGQVKPQNTVYTQEQPHQYVSPYTEEQAQGQDSTYSQYQTQNNTYIQEQSQKYSTPYTEEQAQPHDASYAAGQAPSQGGAYAAGQAQPQDASYAEGQSQSQGASYTAGQSQLYNNTYVNGQNSNQNSSAYYDQYQNKWQTQYGNPYYQQQGSVNYEDLSSTATLSKPETPSLRQNTFFEVSNDDYGSEEDADGEGKTRYIKPDMDVTTLLTSDGSKKEDKAVLIQVSTGHKYGITKDKTVIGKVCSAPQSDICINNRTVSRKHACITVIGDKYFIEDLGSTNKTHINGIDIGRDRMLELKDNDRVVLSDEEFIFYIN
ncbi:FHA domain-containing protein [Eubacterium ruminantium]|nr:FHA domain-containing protein [Eubacterium ruminantium]